MNRTIKRILAAIIGITTVFTCVSCLNKNPSAPENRTQEVKPLADVEMSEKEAVQIVDGKKVLDLSKYITSSAAKKSITLDEVKKVIELSEKLMTENDVVMIGNVRIERLCGINVNDKNTSDTMTSDDYYEYEENISDIAKYLLTQICDPALKMNCGQNYKLAMWSNSDLYKSTVSFIENTDEIKERGYSNWLDYSIDCGGKLSDTGMFVFVLGDIYYCDKDGKTMDLFPSEKIREAHRAKIISESAGYPVE